jgi:isopenicillin-N epimerase
MHRRRDFLRLSSGFGAVWAMADAGRVLIQGTDARPINSGPDNESYWRTVQRAFDVDRSIVNLNNANSSPSPRVVQESLKSKLDYSNRLPVYNRGLIEATFDRVRQRMAESFGCMPGELALTRNASESMHIAQFGIDLRPGDEVLTTEHDYTRVLWAWGQRLRRDGISVKRISFPLPTSSGEILDRFERAFTDRTRVVQFCHITNITGQLFPVRELSRLARARGALTIVDGAQALGHIPVSLHDLECDVYAGSLHKWLMAPIGTGLLYVRRDAIDRIWPLQAAIDDVRDNIQKFEEIGTHPAAVRAAIGDALDFHRAIGPERKAARLRYLTLRWANALRAHPRIKVLSDLSDGQTWGLAMVALDGMPSPTLERYMFERHRMLTYGMVSQGPHGPSFDFQGLRVSPGVYTTTNEIDRFVDAMHDAAARGVSTRG